MLPTSRSHPDQRHERGALGYEVVRGASAQRRHVIHRENGSIEERNSLVPMPPTVSSDYLHAVHRRA
jgi:hypothetical protein